MDTLTKSREEICKNCERGIIVENCMKCLFNLLNTKGDNV